MSCGPCGPTIAGEPAGGGGSGPPGPPGPPGPAGGCANTVIVEAADPFATLPAPVGSTITLLPDTNYRFCGAVAIGAATLELPPSSMISGEDPLVDSVTSTLNGPAIRMLEGGTVKDLSVVQVFPIRPASGCAIQIGGGPLAQNSVVFNCSLRGEEAAICIEGDTVMVSIARVLSMGSAIAVRVGAPASVTTVFALSIDQVVAANSGSQFVGVALEPNTDVNAMSVSLSSFTGSLPADFGIRTAASGLITTLRVSSCAYFGPGTPSQIAQGPPLPFATTGTARNSEAVGCVGFTNSRTRAGAQIINAFTPTTGSLVPIGTGAGPVYTLAPGTSRFRLDGATGPTQSLQYLGFAPADVNVTGYVSVSVGAGFALSPRIIVAAIFIDRNDGLGFVQAGAPFASTTPNFTTAAPCFIAVSEGITLEEDDKLQLRILNSTDLDPLLVLAARLVIGEE